MFLLVDNDIVVGITDTDTGTSVPDSVGSEVEAALMRGDVTVRYSNGDITLTPVVLYWKRMFEDAIRAKTRPTILEINYGETIKFPLIDLPIIVAYANSSNANRNYIDMNGVMHMLTTYEWKNVLDITSDILSELACIQQSMLLIKVDSESRYNSMLSQLVSRVKSAYGRT